MQKKEPKINSLPVDAATLGRLGDQLKRGLDRVGFEADRLVRANRLRGEVSRTHERVDQLTRELGLRVVSLAENGTLLPGELQPLVEAILEARRDSVRLDDNLAKLTAEQWTGPGQFPGQKGPVQRSVRQLGAGSRVGTEPHSAGNLDLCPICASPVRPASVFCPHCGYRLIP